MCNRISDTSAPEVTVVKTPSIAAILLFASASFLASKEIPTPMPDPGVFVVPLLSVNGNSADVLEGSCSTVTSNEFAVAGPATVTADNVPTLVKEEEVILEPNVVADSTSSLLILYTEPDFRSIPVEVNVALVSKVFPLRVLNAREPTSDPAPTLVKIPSMLAIDLFVPAAFSDAKVIPTPIPAPDVDDVVCDSVNTFFTVLISLLFCSRFIPVALSAPDEEYITALFGTTAPGWEPSTKLRSVAELVNPVNLFKSVALALNNTPFNFKPFETPS